MRLSYTLGETNSLTENECQSKSSRTSVDVNSGTTGEVNCSEVVGNPSAVHDLAVHDGEVEYP